MGLFSRSSDPPTKDQFAQQFLAAVRKAGEKRQVDYNPQGFLLTTADEPPRRMFLGNIYAEYCSADKELREKALSRFVRSWFVAEKSIPEEFEDASYDLLPAVRERAYFELAALMMELEGGKQSAIPYQPIGDHLAVALVYDLPDAMQTIPQPRLDQWGVTLYEAMEVARQNLSKLPHAFVGPEEGDGVYMSMTNDNYDACRLLLLDTIRQFHVQGDPVAMIPNRDTLIVTGADDEDGIRMMVALAKNALQKPRPMSGLALRLDGEEWVSWMPPVSHPSHGELRGLQIRRKGSIITSKSNCSTSCTPREGSTFSPRRSPRCRIRRPGRCGVIACGVRTCMRCCHALIKSRSWRRISSRCWWIGSGPSRSSAI